MQNIKGLGQIYRSTDLDRSKNCIIERKRGFRPSDRYDESKKQILLELSRKLWKKKNESNHISRTVDLRKIFTPATDAPQILPKNRKLYASSAFYSPTLHPTVEDQVELARRISHSLSDISNQTSKGQTMYVNRKKRSVKWVHEGCGQGEDENIVETRSLSKENAEDNLLQPELIKLDKMPLKLVMNPRGQMRDYNSLKESINIESGLLSPDNCAELITALQLHKGRGAELFAKRRRKADNWVVDETNAGIHSPSGIPDYQQYQANRPGPTSPSIVPAYSDAGKHRVQLNLHQDQLIEKYSKPGVQVVKSPWEAALQTGSASTAFLEQAQYRSQTPIVAQPSPVHFTQDFTDSPSLPASYANSSNYVNDSYKSSFDTRAKSQSIQSSNPQRELAYKPSVAQGWGGRNVELPREYYFQIQQQPEFEKHNFNDPRNSYYNGNEQLFVDPNAYGINMQFPQTDFNLNDDIHQRLQQLEQFQQCFMQQQMKQLKLKSNGNLPMAKCIGSMSSTNTKPIERSEVQQVVAEERSKAEEAGEPVNVRELIFTFEQQSLRERELTPNIQNELSSDKKRLPTLSLNTSKSSTNQMNDQDTIKGLYVPKEISLASYAPPPVQSTHNFQSSPKPMDYSAKEYELPSYPGFPISNLKPGLYNSVPPKEQLYNSTSYQKFPSSSVQAGPQVSFSPSPLSFDKLSKFQESPDQRNQRYFNGNKQPAYRGVQNVSPTPFLSGGAGGHNDRLPISSPTYGSNTSHNVGSQQGRGANQSFNNSARGWNKGTNNIQPNVYHPKTVSISATESLPYSDF
ncbi:uncharacterized protein LOC111597814 isoform X5 [Drosophila hydei]|uniref:Uncharacterized protein LOC111597814 isoform X5 n=1 Tax=Drosophila hydei TaxID=7224 RepID=A0A6J1LNV5_DROHY|nr:uncharacterized protein LOC111597814 isoform X5 [Drosophila hydei]